MRASPRFLLALVWCAAFFLQATPVTGQGGDDPAVSANTTPSAEIEPIEPIAPVGGSEGPGLEIRLGSGEDGEVDMGVAIQLLMLMTLLSVGPGLVMMMTSFMRIIIVLGFLRSAMGLQSTPPNQMLVGMAGFLTFFLMMPIGEKIYDQAIVPLQAEEITSEEAFTRAAEPLKEFMLKQTRPSDIEFFLGVSGSEQTAVEDLPMRIVIPSFMLSELRTAFQMGFLIFLPFLIVDFVTASVLMSMGMMMMPPVIVSLPFKVLLFVLVDGWFLLFQSLVSSF
ncbi:MAG: flagellar type III secretion system pore protein FliP [Opitutales bacterium]